jgi:hypothetical protein
VGRTGKRGVKKGGRVARENYFAEELGMIYISVLVSRYGMTGVEIVGGTGRQEEVAQGKVG